MNNGCYEMRYPCAQNKICKISRFSKTTKGRPTGIETFAVNMMVRIRKQELWVLDHVIGGKITGGHYLEELLDLSVSWSYMDTPYVLLSFLQNECASLVQWASMDFSKCALLLDTAQSVDNQQGRDFASVNAYFFSKSNWDDTSRRAWAVLV